MHRLHKQAVALLLAACFLFSLSPASAASSPLSILLIGEDASDKQGRSDTMLLARVLPETGEIRLLSFLRDLYVSIPGHGKTRLNAAYFYGGAPLLQKTLERTFDVRIDRYIAVDFALMADLIDQVGGVEIDITEPERRQLNAILRDYGGGKADTVTEAGLQRLNGMQALSFSRIRKIDSDFKRTQRQQAVVTALLKELMHKDLLTLARLAAANLPRVETNLTLGDLSNLLPVLRNKEAPDIRTARVPFDGTFSEDTVNKMMVLVPNAEQNKRQIKKFLNIE